MPIKACLAPFSIKSAAQYQQMKPKKYSSGESSFAFFSKAVAIGKSFLDMVESLLY